MCGQRGRDTLWQEGKRNVPEVELVGKGVSRLVGEVDVRLGDRVGVNPLAEKRVIRDQEEGR